jgi:S-adenosylmethionine hydrolase
VSRPIVTFTSDFGTDDWFVGVVHGVIHSICPEARVVDVAHSVPPGHIPAAAFILEAAAPDFPAGTIHLAVVDPGVGTSRRAIALSARGQLFVGPDNGVLEWGLADPAAEVHELAEPRFFRQPVSRTFHGRDVFAPVAAHLANGVRLADLGPVVRDPVRLGMPACRAGQHEVTGAVMHVDRFGNGLTNITAEALAKTFPGSPESALVFEVVSRTIHGLSRSYGDSPVGAVVAILGSSGRLEIAQVGGHASSRLGFGAGDRVRVSLTGPPRT